MKRIFFIIDCSGSILYSNTRLGVINDLLNELYLIIKQVNSSSKVIQTCIILYSDEANIYKSFNEDEIFYEIDQSKFGLRSNLGKAYALIQSQIKTNSLSLDDIFLVLISDGMATDNYLPILKNLDSNNEMYRIAFSIGRDTDTLEKHVGDTESLIFKKSDDFIIKFNEITYKWTKGKI